MMKNLVLPPNIAQVFALNKRKDLLSALTKEIVVTIKCDRCFIYLRDPDTRLGKAEFCYRLDDSIPDVTTQEWSKESPAIEAQDPMFAAALNCQPHIFIEDIETADSQVVNAEFERENFGHRALIHAHLCHEGQLWGVLQPCVFDRPRIWTSSDRQLIAAIAEQTAPLVMEYVLKANS